MAGDAALERLDPAEFPDGLYSRFPDGCVMETEYTDVNDFSVHKGAVYFMLPGKAPPDSCQSVEEMRLRLAAQGYSVAERPSATVSGAFLNHVYWKVEKP